MYELNCTLQMHLGSNIVYMLIYLTRNFILLKNSRTPVDRYMRMRSSVPLGTRAHPGGSCDLVNQLARETRQLSCSPSGKGSQVKALRIESPPSVKHPWTTATLECRSFAITRPPHVSLLFDLILPRRPFKAAYFSCG